MSRADRLLRAAVTGYCALTRPRRYDAQQLQDLAMPLVGGASRDTLRYVAAALSKCETEPPELVRELSRMSIDIAAPLLSRSQTLTDTDLIILIGAKGIGHARAIARRPNLHPSIAQLIRLIEMRNAASKSKLAAPAKPTQKQDERPENTHLERAREKLRTMMLAARVKPNASEAEIRQAYEMLRDAALKGGSARFVSSLSECLGISRTTAWIVARDASCKKIILACRAIGLTEEQSYLIASALFPQHFQDAESIAQFLESFREASMDSANSQIEEWQAEPVVRTALSG